MGKDAVEPTRLGEIEEERLARLVRLASRAFRRSLELRLAAHGISFGQWTFMRILWKEDGLSQRQLSERAGLTEPTVHAAIVKLEAMGLVIRRMLGGNRRRQHVFLTEAGAALRDRLEPLALDANARAVAGLADDDVQRLRTGLLTLIRNLEEDERQAADRGVKVPPTRGHFG